jgi:thiol-disulfide isomerase/thioredoxin
MAGPDFFLRDWCGPDQELRIAARRDEKKVVVLSTFATWCAPCRQELPCLQAFADSMADAPVVWRLINPAERTDSVKAFLAQLDVALPVLFDRYGRVYPRLGNGFPAVIVIDREGVIRYLHEGYGAGVIDEIRDSVEAALPDATTRAGLSNPTAVRASAQPTRER